MNAQKWADFYLVAGPSAAVLIGLLFVALSINRAPIAAHHHLGGQARQAVYALVTILAVSLVVLIPDQSSAALGAELIAGGILNLALAIPRQSRRLRAMPVSVRTRFVPLAAVYDGAMVLIAAGGVALAAGLDSGLSFVAPAVIALALLAIANSWQLTLLYDERESA
jgi:hypothetical protein